MRNLGRTRRPGSGGLVGRARRVVVFTEVLVRDVQEVARTPPSPLPTGLLNGIPWTIRSANANICSSFKSRGTLFCRVFTAFWKSARNVLSAVASSKPMGGEHSQSVFVPAHRLLPLAPGHSAGTPFFAVGLHAFLTTWPYPIVQAPSAAT